MQIDRRITNGLAWAGAILVVGIPAADFALRQMVNPAPQVSVVQEEIADPVSMPTPTAERPQVAATPQAPAPAAPASDPIVTAATSGTNSADPVDRFIDSGRDLPSYISGGSTPTSTPRTENTQPTQAVTPAPARPAATTPARETVATVPATPVVPPASTAPRTRLVTLPTPVSQRPAQVAARPPVITPPAPVAAQPPLIVDEPDRIVSARDLEDWESGPLSEFLSGRGGGGNATQDFDPNGFFLDEGPNPRRVQRLPDAYDDDYYYPFSQ